MTLAMAIVLNRESPNVNEVQFLADSRLTTTSGAFDHAIKVVSLGLRSAVAMAGATTLPVWTAVECARPWISYTNRERTKNGEPCLSVWEEAAILLAYLEPAHAHAVSLMLDPECQVLLGGFLKSGTACVFEFRFTDGTFHVVLHAPPPGEKRCAVIGTPEYANLLRKAYDAKGTYYDAMSVLWDIVKHQGLSTAGIGGGVSFAFCTSEMEEFSWRPIEVDGRIFHRGLPLEKVRGAHVALKIPYDPSLFAELERSIQFDPRSGTQFKSEGFAMGVGQIVVGDGLYHALASFSAEEPWLATNVPELHDQRKAPPT